MPATTPRVLDPELRQHARRLVAEAPPLTEAQRRLIAALFQVIIKARP